MLANLKTVLIYCVTWYALCLPGNFLVPISYSALHGGAPGRVFLHMIHHPWRPSDGAAILAYTLLHYSLVMGIGFRTLNVRAIKRPGDPLARVLFASVEVGLSMYFLFAASRWGWHHKGAWSLVEGLPSLLATVGAGYALRFVWPRPPQAQPALSPSEGIWPPPPHLP